MAGSSFRTWWPSWGFPDSCRTASVTPVATLLSASQRTARREKALASTSYRRMPNRSQTVYARNFIGAVQKRCRAGTAPSYCFCSGTMTLAK